VSNVGSYVGCDCAMVFAARVQAIADQIMGVVALTEAKMIEPSGPQLIIHYAKGQAMLQQAIYSFTSEHGEPDAAHQVEAAEWLLRALRY
jgi:hypothetical protein